MSRFTGAGSTYGLARGDLILVRVTATNTYGTGVVSAANSAGAQVREVPGLNSQMAAPTRGALTSISQIVVDWAALVAPTNGDSAIDSYHLTWDRGTGTWTDLVGISSNYLQLSYTVGTGITPGNPYKFQVRAHNIYGWGPASSEKTILASEVPA
jgi:hypothetical protein